MLRLDHLPKTPDPFVPFDYQTLGISAFAGSDFVETAGTITFAPGVTSRTVIVPTLNDEIAEPTESFSINLTAAQGATIADDIGFGIITDTDVDETAPQVEAFVINDGTAQRSVIRELTVTFSEQVSVDENAFVVLNTTTNTTYVPSVDVQAVGGKSVAKLTFPMLAGGSLPDGNYTLTIHPSQVADAAANLLDGDQDGSAGDPARFEFFRLLGDADGDRDVDARDFLQFRSTYRRDSDSGLFKDEFDFDGDGDVDARDFLQFRRNYRRSLPTT
ncbi:Calx-beta domain-containing protein [Crateriforma spongiae]|uniref:Calx-beta domain-containing protein n=1 Tax=Crateriforma spongiae TaxID=2724528 RepID=UPI0039B06436